MCVGPKTPLKSNSLLSPLSEKLLLKRKERKKRAEEKKISVIFCLEIQCTGYSGQLMNSFKKFIKGMKTMWTKAFGFAGRQFIN